jgi:predicted phosphodiesterase
MLKFKLGSKRLQVKKLYEPNYYEQNHMTRVAIFSDVHGNAFALEAVLADISRYTIDAMGNLGDQVWGAADPARAFNMQQELFHQRGVLCVRGNTDERMGTPLEQVNEKKRGLEWLHSLLPKGAGEYLGNLPLVAELLDGEILLAHGALHSAWDALLRENGQWISGTPLLERIQNHPKAKVVLVGHTHLEYLAQVESTTFVNAGAVSNQLDGCPDARWVLLERRAGRWSVSFQRVAYDFEAAAQWALEHEPDGGESEAFQLRFGRKK